MAGGVEGAGYGERAEFVCDGTEVGVSSAQVKTRSRFWMAGGVEGAGYGERAEFVCDGTEVGVLSARR